MAGGLRRDAVELVDVCECTDGLSVTSTVLIACHCIACAMSSRSRSPAHGWTTAAACAVSVRVAFAASLLRRAGHGDVVRIAGGGVPNLTARGIDLTVGAGCQRSRPATGRR